MRIWIWSTPDSRSPCIFSYFLYLSYTESCFSRLCNFMSLRTVW